MSTAEILKQLAKRANGQTTPEPTTPEPTTSTPQRPPMTAEELAKALYPIAQTLTKLAKSYDTMSSQAASQIRESAELVSQSAYRAGQAANRMEDHVKNLKEAQKEHERKESRFQEVKTWVLPLAVAVSLSLGVIAWQRWENQKNQAQNLAQWEQLEADLKQLKEKKGMVEKKKVLELISRQKP